MRTHGAPGSVHFDRGHLDDLQALAQLLVDLGPRSAPNAPRPCRPAYAANPERFGHRRPTPTQLPTAAGINQPSKETLSQSN